MMKMFLSLAICCVGAVADNPAGKETHLVGVGDMMLDGSKDFPWLNLVTDSVPNLSIYHSTAAIESAVASMQCAHGQISIENNKGLQVVSLTNADSPVKEKVRAFYVFGIHGREYISSETALKFLTQMCDGSERSKALLNAVDFRIIPVANPVGRKKVEQGHSCVDQRKNANNVDLNRNFDIKWEQGSSLNDAEDYHGTGAFSEPESQVIKEVAEKFKPKVFVDVHSGDRTMMMPYSYITELCANHQEMDSLLQAVNGAVFASNKVKTGAASRTLDPPYTAAGTTIDFMYEKMGVPFAFTFEIFSGVRTISNIMTSVGGSGIVKDAIIPLSVYNNQTQGGAASMLETETSLEVPSLDGPKLRPPQDVISLLSEPARPVDHSAMMSLMDCFAYFNPTSKELVEATASQWSNSLFHVAEYFLAKPGP